MVTPLSVRTKEIILGSLLGDGSLAINDKYANARFSFRHSTAQEIYFFWKVRELKEISSEHCFWLQGKEKPDGWGEKKYRFQSRALPQLTELFFLTHGNGYRTQILIRRKWLNQLSPLSLAIWWQDDGSLVSDSRQGVICTDGFSLEEVKILDRYMKKVWNINTAIGTVKQTGRYRLWIRSTKELEKFLRIIIPHIYARDMLKKVLLLYKDPKLQQRWISEIIALGNFPENIIIEEILKRKSTLKMFSDKDIVQPL